VSNPIPETPSTPRHGPRSIHCSHPRPARATCSDVPSLCRCPVVLAAFYSRRVTAWGAVAAIAGGTIVTLSWDLTWVNKSFAGIHALFPPIIADRDAIFPALLVAVLAMIIVSAVTPKPHAEQLARFAD
jgi:Na+/proline symporter